MKTVLKSLFLGVPIAIAILCLIGTTIWQYIEYDRELGYYKIQERWYEAIYVGDKYKIKNKSIDYISILIQDIKCNINNISHVLPMEGYLNVYKLMNKFEGICVLNNIRFELLEIKASSKMFFDEIEIHCNLKGNTEGIHNSLNGLITDRVIKRWKSACFTSNQKTELSLYFSAFLYTGKNPPISESKPSRVNPLEYNDVNTWLPPFSLLIKKYHKRSLAYKAEYSNSTEFLQKIKMFEELKDLRRQEREMSLLIESLIELCVDSEKKIADIQICL